MSILPIILRSDDRVEGATITSSAETTGYPDDNVTDWKDYTLWSASGASSYWLKADAGSGVTADSMGIAGHNLDTVSITQIKLEGSNDDITYTEVIANFSPPNGDDAIAKTFTQATWRYWKLTIATAGANAVPQIGIWYVGNKIELPRGPKTPFDPDRIIDKSSKFIGGAGNLIGVTNPYSLRKFRYTHNLISQTFVTNTWLPFIESYRLSPFLFAWDPDSHSSAVRLVWLDTDDHTSPYDGKWRTLDLPMIGRKV